jgi:hypothetical protein
MNSGQRVYKFLTRGRRGPISGFEWPSPDAGDAAWVEVQGPLELGVWGLHVCREIDLAHWVHDELWELATTGEQTPGIDCVVMRRARLLRRIDAWTDGGRARFANACIERAGKPLGHDADAIVRGFLGDAEAAAQAGYFALSAYAAALAVAKRDVSSDQEDRFRSERAWQSQWIANELLSP